MTNKLILSNKSREIIGDTFLTRLSPNDLDKKINEAYLGVLTNDKTLFNPFEKIPAAAGDKFAEYVTYVMSQPEYFYFIIKYIFGMDTFPQQALILKELYTHKFPLLIGTRGLGKSVSLALYMLIRMILIPGTRCIITSAGFRQAKVVFDYMERIWDKAPILQSCFKGGRNGPTHGTDVWTFRLGDSLTYALPVGPDGSKVRGYRANCVHGDTLVQTDKGLVKIKDFENKRCEAVININKAIESPKSFYSTEPVDVYEVTTELGYSIKYSEIHQINGPDGWIKANELKVGDSLQLDNNDFFPMSYAEYEGNRLDESQIFFSGLINLSSMASEEVPWYILQSPRNIVYRYLKLYFGEMWTGKSTYSKYHSKVKHLQILLLKFGFISSIEFIDNKFKLTVIRQHVEFPDGSAPTDVVKSIVKLDKKESLYDFELMETHSFRGGGFINHNCLISDEFSCTRNSLIGTDHGLLKIEDIVNNQIKCNVYNMNGELEPVIGYAKTPKTDVYRLTTKYNYQIDFSENHRFMTAEGEWKKGVNLTQDDYILFDNKYRFPENDIDTYSGIDPKDLAYLYGLLISEGNLTNKYYVSVINTDKKLIDDLVSRFKILNPKVYTKKATIDSRGWKCKESYIFRVHSRKFKDFLISQGLSSDTAINKEIPSSILKSNKECVLSFLKGLFIGDGSAFLWNNRDNTKVGCAYYSSSITLINQLHTLLKSLGYIAYKNNRSSNISKNKQWFLRLNGTYAIDFIKEIKYPNFSDLISKITPCKDRLREKTGSIYLRKKYNDYKVCSYLNGKSIYLGLTKTKEDGVKKIEEFLKSSKLCVQVKSIEKLDEQDHLYDVSLPTTHSYYANGLVNHNTMNRQVFEEVMSGFLTVAASPVEQIKQNARYNTMKQLYIPIPKSDNKSTFLENQLILSGTAYYKINHFYSYFNKWNQIILSKNDPKLLNDMFKEKEDRKDINADDYSIIRIPIELTANGYMDMSQVARIKASTTKDVYLREYSGCFNDDSDGFFKKSLIDSCTCEEGDKDLFPPALYGTKAKKYVYGVDPAYEGDNFAVVILEINGGSRRVVHAWTTQASDHKQRLRDGVITEHDYYHYCARKIRDLMKRFPCEYIALDSQGGGNALMEAFRDITKIKETEHVILPTIEPEEKTKETDLLPGLHIIKVINFTSEWISKANYALKKDMEDKTIRFPINDAVSYALAEYYDESMGDSKELYDTLDDCIFEIEELKKELTTITVTETTTGREKFDTPSVKVGINRKGRLKKDRYSALIMANFISREIAIDSNRMEGTDILNLSNYIFTENKTKLFRGNNKIADQLNKLYGNM